METKIQLSAEELTLMQNSEWILTKNRIIEKVMLGFGALSERMRAALHEGGPMAEPALMQSAPKITRGEKYQGLPYVMLDYPAIFGREHVLAVRTFYWWGNFCSITLHVKGRYKSMLSEKIGRSLTHFAKGNVYLSVSDLEWNHDVNSTHYLRLSTSMTPELTKSINKGSFLKLSAKVQFSQWDEMQQGLFEHFLALCRVMEA